MKKKLEIVAALYILLCLASLLINKWLFIALVIVAILCLLMGIGFLVCNRLLKATNWWHNQYQLTHQFVSNEGYRENIIRNYDIVNLGSNPAHFAFFYDEVKGQSWATGSQGQDMDFELLKYYHSYIRRGGTVLIPIMPFTAISSYLKEKPSYWGLSYYSKFYQLLDIHQRTSLPFYTKLGRYLNYPLLYNRQALRYVIKDVQPDNRFMITEQPMMQMELEVNAKMWIDLWLKEFDLLNLNDVLEEKWAKYYSEAVILNQNIVEFCLARDLKPVFICVPLTKHLSSLFPDKVRQFLVTDFVSKANVHNVPFLDYTTDERFQKDELYFNSFFLNLKGRKLFTHQVLIDLNIIK